MEHIDNQNPQDVMAVIQLTGAICATSIYLTPWLDKIILCRQPDFVVQIGLCRERSEQPAREAARSAAERASEVRGSAPIELRQGSGGAAPGKF